MVDIEVDDVQKFILQQQYPEQNVDDVAQELWDSAVMSVYQQSRQADVDVDDTDE